jgi:alpha-beta hydrolase superfamily lysophospholipase
VREFIGKTFPGKLLESSAMTTEKPFPSDLSASVDAVAWRAAEEGFLDRGKDTRLFFRLARATGDPRAVVVLTHGLGEHSSRYGHVAAGLVGRGLQVGAWDLRGHGRSSGCRGDVPDYDLLVEDLAAACAHFRVKGLPLFLFAHSLGAQIALSFLEQRSVECDGAVIASPWLRLAFDPPWWKLFLARLAMRWRPTFIQQTGTRLERLSRDLEHLGSFPDLDLVHHGISARMYFSVREAGERLLARAEAVRTPLLLLHGDDDPVTSHHATCEFFERAGAQDKTLRIYPGVRHETHNDLDRALVIREVGNWIEARLPAAGGAQT